jgi:hypothetical protein
MKKQNIKSLRLNKKSISNFKVTGGRPPRSGNCLPVRSDNNYTCEPVDATDISMIAGIICGVSIQIC